MSSLNSSSTIEQIKAAYADNASYSEDASVAKARAFVTACRLLLLKLPKSSGSAGGNVTLSPELIAKEMELAQAYVSDSGATTEQGGAGPRVTHADFRSFRT
jgi:hypothetical protein